MATGTTSELIGSKFSKVAAVTLSFWIIKILCTTLGEAGGDAVTMGDAALKFGGLGYLLGTAIFAVLFLALVAAQITAKKFHPQLYWATIIAPERSTQSTPLTKTRLSAVSQGSKRRAS